MKKLLISILGLLCMASCNDSAEVVEESCPNFEFETQTSFSNLDYIQQRIGMEHPQTRVGETVSIEPYVYEGDTVMYIVNYEDGWELYSNDTSLPMILGKSDTGNLDLSLESIPDNQKGYIENFADLIYARRVNGLTDSRSLGEWNNYILPDSIDLRDTLLSDEGKYPGPVDPIYEVTWAIISRRTISCDSVVIPHLIYNRWHQKRPWNMYCPYYYGNPRNEHYLVGCGAIALGQFLHNMAISHNYPIPIPKYAEFDQNTNSFVFSESTTTTTIWGNMALDGTTQTLYTDSAALALGYLGQKIYMQYGGYASSSYFSDIADYLRSIGLTCTITPIDSSYIFSSIENGYTIICRGGNTDYYNGHFFVIDGMKRIVKHDECIYGLVRNGQIVPNSPTKSIVRQINLDYIQMNWGWRDHTVDDFWFVPIYGAEWDADGSVYNTQSIIKVIHNS